MEFTRSQLKAINHEGANLQLIACAGSGKTEVVARRVARLLLPGKRGGLSPRNIIAFTFTERAASELKERIHARYREQAGAQVGLAEMYVGTIHGFCLELLKAEVPRFSRFELLNEVRQSLFVNRNSQHSGLTQTTQLDGGLLRRYIDTSRYLSALNLLRESDIIADSLRGCSILEEAAAVLERDARTQQRLRERVQHVIVDEYQDLNPIQERIVRALHDLGAKVCVVGDDDQTIYQWRGSDVGGILRFSERYPRVEQIRLEENFRSSEGVIETARHFIEQNPERLKKHMVHGGAQRFEQGDLAALTFEDPEAEAAFIVRTLRNLHGLAIKHQGGAAALLLPREL